MSGTLGKATIAPCSSCEVYANASGNPASITIHAQAQSNTENACLDVTLATSGTTLNSCCTITTNVVPTCDRNAILYTSDYSASSGYTAPCYTTTCTYDMIHFFCAEDGTLYNNLYSNPCLSCMPLKLTRCCYVNSGNYATWQPTPACFRSPNTSYCFSAFGAGWENCRAILNFNEYQCNALGFSYYYVPSPAWMGSSVVKNTEYMFGISCCTGDANGNRLTYAPVKIAALADQCACTKLKIAYQGYDYDSVNKNVTDCLGIYQAECYKTFTTTLSWDHYSEWPHMVEIDRQNLVPQMVIKRDYEDTFCRQGYALCGFPSNEPSSYTWSVCYNGGPYIDRFLNGFYNTACGCDLAYCINFKVGGYFSPRSFSGCNLDVFTNIRQQGSENCHAITIIDYKALTLNDPTCWGCDVYMAKQALGRMSLINAGLVSNACLNCWCKIYLGTDGKARPVPVVLTDADPGTRDRVQSSVKWVTYNPEDDANYMFIWASMAWENRSSLSSTDYSAHGIFRINSDKIPSYAADFAGTSLCCICIATCFQYAVQAGWLTRVSCLTDWPDSLGLGYNGEAILPHIHHVAPQCWVQYIPCLALDTPNVNCGTVGDWENQPGCFTCTESGATPQTGWNGGMIKLATKDFVTWELDDGTSGTSCTYISGYDTTGNSAVLLEAATCSYLSMDHYCNSSCLSRDGNIEYNLSANRLERTGVIMSNGESVYVRNESSTPTSVQVWGYDE